MTIVEKVIAAMAGVESVKPGDTHTVNLGRLMSSDGTTHLTIDIHRNQLKRPRIADTSRLVSIVDHNVPTGNPKTVTSQEETRDFARENGIDFWEGKGIHYQIMTEHYVRPGELIFGADSHTYTYGALGTFGTGVGCMDYLHDMMTGISWASVPETVKSSLVGRLRPGIYPRDLMLAIIGQVGVSGRSYQVMEFTGEGVKTLSANNRVVLCNLAVEAGVKTGIVEVDKIALEHLKEHGRTLKVVYHNDEGAVYAGEYTFDLSKVEPVAARPDFVDDMVPASEVAGIAIDEAFLSSCNNGRIDGLRVGVAVIKGKKVAERVRFFVVPASNGVYQQALKEGPIEILMEADAIVMSANCSVRWGSCQGVIGKSEALISANTGDSKGRAGHPNSKVYLASAATMAASAMAGVITMADQLM